jgi:hypothetical protein
VDDLFGIRPVAPTSRFPNVDVGILVWQQRNVVVFIKPVPPRMSHPIFRRKPNASHMCARITISHI